MAPSVTARSTLRSEPGAETCRVDGGAVGADADVVLLMRTRRERECAPIAHMESYARFGRTGWAAIACCGARAKIPATAASLAPLFPELHATRDTLSRPDGRYVPAPRAGADHLGAGQRRDAI